MTARAVARRYAGALFDVVRKNATMDRAERDLAAFGAMVAGHEELRRVFDTPAVAVAKKRALVDALVASAGDLSPDVARLLALLADRDRLALLPDVIAAFGERVMQTRRIVAAEVVTAMPLGDERRAALAAALGRAAGSDVTISERVDPSIVGGVVARVGSVVFDGSVTRQLARMKARLLSEA